MDEHIKILINGYVGGTLDDEDAAVLAEWVNRSEENAACFRREVRTLLDGGATTSDAVNFWNRVSERKKQSSRGIRSGFWKYAVSVAAAVAVCAFSSLVAYLTVELKSESVKIAGETSSPVPQEVSVAKSPVIYASAYGERKTVILPDSSRVILNSGARLILSDEFNVRERRVDLDGEAYFEVTGNPAKLFVVCCGDSEYVVRGTSFNISSYSNDRFSVITLHTGKLEARVKDDVIMLKPGEELRVDRIVNQMTKLTVDVSNSISWRNNGQLSFSNLPLKFVANKFAHKYNVRINVHSSIEDFVYDGQIDTESLTDALRLISMTAPVPLSVTEFKGEYFISKRSI